MAAASEGADVCHIPSHLHQDSAPIPDDIFGHAPPVSDHTLDEEREWLQKHLDLMLENAMTKKLRAEIEEHETDMELVNSKLSSQEFKVMGFEDKIFDLTQEKKTWVARNQELSRKRDVLQEENEELIAKLTQMSSQQHKQVSSISDKEMDQIRAEHRKKIKLMNDEMGELEFQVESLQGQHETQEAQIKKLREELQHLHEEKDHLEQENAKYRKIAGNADDLLNQKTNMHDTVKELQGENEELKRHLADMERDRDQAMKHKRKLETQLSGYKEQVTQAQHVAKTSRGRIDTLQAEIDRLTEEANELRTRGGTQARSINITMASGGAGSEDQALEIQRLKRELEENRYEYSETLERKDRMLKEVKDALKSLGLKLGNLDSKTAIPKLKALLSILTKQVGEYKGRQRELEHLLKSRLNEIEHLKHKLTIAGTVITE